MRKTLLLAGVACLFSLQSKAADFKPYIGLDAGASHIEYTSYQSTGLENYFDENFGIASLNIGTRIGDYFGLELSTTGSTASENSGVDFSYSSVGLDAFGYVPLTTNMELFASAGAGYYTLDLKSDAGYKDVEIHYQDSDYAFRLGAGAQYNFNDNWAMRGMIRHAFFDDNYFVDSITEATLGVRYSF